MGDVFFNYSKSLYDYKVSNIKNIKNMKSVINGGGVKSDNAWNPIKLFTGSYFVSDLAPNNHPYSFT